MPDLGVFYVDEIKSASRWLGREEVGLEIGRLLIEYGAATNVQDRESTEKQLARLFYSMRRWTVTGVWYIDCFSVAQWGIQVPPSRKTFSESGTGRSI